MNLLSIISSTLLILCTCIGCTEHSGVSDKVFEERAYTPQHASGFCIDADSEGNTLLRVTRPWQGDDIVEQRLAIFRSREAAEGYRGAHIIGDAERIICMSTSHIAMLECIGEVGRVVGVSGKEYIMSSAIAQNNTILDVGYDSNLDFETLVALHPDIILMYGITAENTIVTGKLRELGIPYLYLGDYTEQSPLGKAEWLVAIAEIAGCRELGIELFNGITERYEEVHTHATSASGPKVMLNIPYQDVWYMPADDSYMVRLIEDAGGEYIYKGKNPTGGSRGISLEEALLLVREADIWLNVGQCTSLAELRAAAPHFRDCEVVRRGDVYNNNNRRTAAGGSDFWESAIVRPDIVLQDLASIFNRCDDTLYYHHKLN